MFFVFIGKIVHHGSCSGFSIELMENVLGEKKVNTVLISPEHKCANFLDRIAAFCNNISLIFFNL